MTTTIGVCVMVNMNTQIGKTVIIALWLHVIHHRGNSDTV